MSASSKTVAIVIGDIGSAKELIPAAKTLTICGLNVHWIADLQGKGRHVLENEGIHYSVQVYARERNIADLFLIGTSATAVSEQIAWTKFGQEHSIPVVWYEDLWGTGEQPVTRCVDPDLMLVVSQTAVEIARNVRTKLPTQVVGKPSFESIIRVDFPAIKQTIRVRLNAYDHDFVAVYWGGGDKARAWEHISNLIIFGSSRTNFVLVPRLHPKMPGRQQLVTFLNLHPCVRWADEEIPEYLNCAADVVIGEWGSTQTYAAALVGTRPLLALWPDDKQKRIDCGFDNGVPPLISTLVGLDLLSPHDLPSALAVVASHCNSSRSLIASAAHHWFGDACQPGATDRIADAVMRLI